jgi:tetratricopeptide (TPR) repeat protein/MFS family permease
MSKPQIKPKSFTSIFIPSATVFISSFCIMVLELVAGRLTARYLGSSLYTWTSVIGVILTGITIGNYLGGRIADKFSARKALASIFAICSASCVVTVILNNIVGRWMWLWDLSWPLHVFIHISLVFLLPSTLLGTISPVVAKMALDRGFSTGRTVGDIYAWSAAGSIAGTFMAGYYLIAAFGTITIIWTIGAVLLLMSILYWTRFVPLYIWAVVFTCLMTMAMIPAEWAQKTGFSIAVRQQPDPSILYEDESRYSHIAIRQELSDPNRRFFYLDKLTHSEILMDNVLDLQSSYTKIYAAVTEGLSKNKERLCVMAIGGGGYAFPRYIEKVRPGSRIDVAEIDPDVTKAAMRAFGLEENTTINIINMDARNYVDGLLEQKRMGKKIPQYDFIYGDAFNDYSVPFQLVTQEFDEKLYAILGDNGVYMMNLIDIFDSGLFLGSVVNTLQKTFPCVYVVVDKDAHRLLRNTFIIIAAKKNLDLKNIISQHKQGELKLWYLEASDISELSQKSRHLVLTDDYSPAENLLVPVVCDSARIYSAEIHFKQAEELNQRKQFAESIENYLSAAETHPVAYCTASYNKIGIIYTNMGKPERAAEAFNKAVQYNDKSKYKTDVATIRYRLGLILQKLGKSGQAMEQFHKATEELQRELTKNPTHPQNWNVLGVNLNATGDFVASIDAFKKALDLNPDNPVYYDNLAAALERDERYGEAIEVLKKYIQLMKNNNQNEAVSQLQKYLESLEYKNSKSKQAK